MQTVMSTDSRSMKVQIRVSVFVGSIIGFLAVGILIGSFFEAGLMKFSLNYKRKIDISNHNKSSKSDNHRTQNEATFYDEIVLTDQSYVNLSKKNAYGEVNKNRN